MSQTEFFFTSAVDLQEHQLSEAHTDAMYAVYEACKSINQPDQYGSSLRTIIITAVHQDYDSRFHRPFVRYEAQRGRLLAKVRVDLEQVLRSDFPKAVSIYTDLIIDVLERVQNRVPDFDFERLKKDLTDAVEVMV